MANFTKEQVIARFKELGVKPGFGVLGVYVDRFDGGRVECNGVACAMGVMLIGRKLEPGRTLFPPTIAELLEVDYWAFADGFDGFNGYDRDAPEHPDFKLGREIRGAVLADPDLTVVDDYVIYDY